jgi:hypothetical protein
MVFCKDIRKAREGKSSKKLNSSQNEKNNGENSTKIKQ